MSNLPPILFYPPDRCDNCKSRSIELFDYFHNTMGYRSIADNYMQGVPIVGNKLDGKRDIYTMRCRQCGQRYTIRWENDIPLPDTYDYHKDNRFFLEEFKTHKE